MQINKKCRWQKFHKVGESLYRGLCKVGIAYSEDASSNTFKCFEKCQNTSKTSHAHLQCVITTVQSLENASQEV
jgi:hypothetical protein